MALARAGADLVLGARQAGSLAETAALVAATGRRAEPVGLDVRDAAAVAAIVAAIGGPLDILVNNAGVESVRPAADVDEALWDRIVDTNLKGAFFCARAFARLPEPPGRARSIVNLCSLTSEVGIPTAAPYGSSKTGLVGMTRALATEWAPLGIRVNGLGPRLFPHRPDGRLLCGPGLAAGHAGQNPAGPVRPDGGSDGSRRLPLFARRGLYDGPGPLHRRRHAGVDLTPRRVLMALIYKIADEAQWRRAEAGGVFEGAPVDLADGYMHFSTAAQLGETAARHFAGRADLLLVAVEAEALGPALRWEPSRGGALFPHLYGPLRLADVVRIEPIALDPGGRHVFPVDL